MASYYCSASDWPGNSSIKGGPCKDCPSVEDVESEVSYNRFRLCTIVESGCEVGGPLHNCIIDEVTETTRESHCTNTTTCCPSKVSLIVLSNPYTVEILKADVAAMRDAVSWDDFEAWNMGGDVVAFDEDEYHFPHSGETYFTAFYLTDEHETYIDKGWMLIRNPGDESVEVRVTFTPMEGEPTMSVLEIPAHSIRAVDPPVEPGMISVDRSPCACVLVPDIYCETKEVDVRVKHAKYHCSFLPEEDGFRHPYLSARINQSGDYSTEYRYGGTSSNRLIDDDSSNWTAEVKRTFIGETPAPTFSQDSSSRPPIVESYNGLFTGDRTKEWTGYQWLAEAWITSTVKNNGEFSPDAMGVTFTQASGSETYDCLSQSSPYCGWEYLPSQIPPSVTQMFSSALHCDRDFQSPNSRNKFTHEWSPVRVSRVHLYENKIEYSDPNDRHITIGLVTDEVTLEDPLEDELGEDAWDEAEWSDEALSILVCSSYHKPAPLTSTSSIFQRKDARWKIRFSEMTCPSPEIYESFKVIVMWFEIVAPKSCSDEIKIDKKREELTVSRTGSPGSYEWVMPADIVNTLSIKGDNNEEGDICVRYLHAVATDFTQPE